VEHVFDKEALIKTINNTFRSPFEDNNSKRIEVCVHGATRLGVEYKRSLEAKNIVTSFFVDNDPSKYEGNSVLDGVPVVSPSYLNQNYPNITLLISSNQYEEEIRNSWQQLGREIPYTLAFLHFKHPDIFQSMFYNDLFNITYNNKHEIIQLYKDLHDEQSKTTLLNLVKYRLSFDPNYLKSVRSKNEQYFESDILSITDKEVFYDIGAYDGDSIESFLALVDNKYTKCYSFEPLISNCEIINKKCKTNKWNNVEVVNAAVSNTNSSLEVYGEETGIGGGGEDILSMERYIEYDGEKLGYAKNTLVVDTVTIDDFSEKHLKPTFIKMDIEGSEMSALIGGKNVINKYKPKLAICIYHKPSDLSSISKYLKQLNPNYRMYIRHYRDYICDTVLYCI
jgi:FkbM family methyltransferase